MAYTAIFVAYNNRVVTIFVIQPTQLEQEQLEAACDVKSPFKSHIFTKHSKWRIWWFLGPSNNLS